MGVLLIEINVERLWISDLGAILSSWLNLVGINWDRQFWRYEVWGEIMELGEVAVG